MLPQCPVGQDAILLLLLLLLWALQASHTPSQQHAGRVLLDTAQRNRARCKQRCLL
jgi:hypothetical protein